MLKVASNILIIINELDRTYYYKMMYQMLNVIK